MRVGRASLAMVCFLSLAFAQPGANQVARKTLYYLKDDSHQQWCGYKSEVEWKSRVQLLKAMIVGGVDYTNDRVSVVHVTEADETGDWAVHDEYSIDKNGRIRTLKRTIKILPEDTSQEQMFLIQNGKAIKQGSANYELRTGQPAPTQRPVDWFQAPPVITNTQAFAFSLLIDKRQEVWSKGTACTPERSK